MAKKAEIDKVQFLVDEIDRVSSVVAGQTSDLLTNARWYSTIVLAEIAGLVKFAPDLVGFWANLPYFVALALLGLAASSLLYAVHRTTDIKFHFEVALSKLKTDAIFLKGEITDEELLDVAKIIQGFLAAGKRGSDPRSFTDIGLVLFVVGSVVSITIVFAL